MGKSKKFRTGAGLRSARSTYWLVTPTRNEAVPVTRVDGMTFPTASVVSLFASSPPMIVVREFSALAISTGKFTESEGKYVTK